MTGEVLKKLTRPPQPGGAAVRTLKHAVQLARRAKDPEASRLVDGLRAVLQKNDAKYMVTDALFDLQWLTERVVKPPPVVALKLKWSQLSRGLQATSIRADVAPRVDAETLFASVYAAPDDLARRSVLADLLQEQGDPRGAFIALQLQGADPLRAEALLKKMRERGWPRFVRCSRASSSSHRASSACTLRKVSLGQFKAAAGSPLWATVRRLDATYGPGAALDSERTRGAHRAQPRVPHPGSPSPARRDAPRAALVRGPASRRARDAHRGHLRAAEAAPPRGPRDGADARQRRARPPPCPRDRDVCLTS